MSEQDVFNALKYRVEVDDDGTPVFTMPPAYYTETMTPVIFQSGEHWWCQTGRRHRNDGPLLNGVMVPDGGSTLAHICG